MMLGAIIQNTSDLAVLIVLFSFTIFIHEFGHFIAAIKLGLIVDTFSIGFGPAVWKKKVRGITLKIGLLPLGGYVSLPQLDPAGMEKIQGSTELGSESLPPVPPWKRIIVSFAGAAGNVLFAFFLAWIIYLSPSKGEERGSGTRIGYVDTNSVAYAAGLLPGHEIKAVNGEKVKTWQDISTACYLARGRTNVVTILADADGKVIEAAVPISEDGFGIKGVERSLDCVVMEVMQGSPAEVAGVKPGDIISSFDGEPVSSSSHFVRLVGVRPDETLPLVVLREGRFLTLQVTPRYDEKAGRALIGTVIGGAFDPKVMPWMQFKKPLDQVRSDAEQILRILKALITPREAGQAAKGLGGPVMIIATLWIAIKVSILNAIGFLRLLNVNLAIINLLPLPILDGGHIVLSLWEAVTRRKVHPKVLNAMMNVFMVVLICVFVLLTFADCRRSPSLWKAYKSALNQKVEKENAGNKKIGEVPIEPEN